MEAHYEKTLEQIKRMNYRFNIKQNGGRFIEVEEACPHPEHGEIGGTTFCLACGEKYSE